MLLPERQTWPTIVAWALIAACASGLFVRYPAKAAASHPAEQAKVHIPGDFAVYLKAWQRVRAGQDPYVSSDSSPYKYAPGALGMISLLPDEPSRAWFAFGGASILALVFALGVGARYDSWRSVGWLFAGLVLSWKGILETLDYGQLELLILGVAVAGAATLRRAPLVSGFLLGLLPGIKLPWVLVFLPFLINAATPEPDTRRRRRFSQLATGYFLAWFTWAAAIPSLMFGPEKAKALSQSWLRLLETQPPGLYTSDLNQGLFGSALRWLGPGREALALGLSLAVSGLLLGVLIARLARNYRERDSLGWITPWLLATQLFNPLAWRWGSVYAVGAPLASERGARAKPALEIGPVSAGAIRWALWAALVPLWLAQQSPVVKLFGVSHWTELHPYGVVTAYWATLILLSA
jgi:hypothetical protein